MNRPDVVPETPAVSDVLDRLGIAPGVPEGVRSVGGPHVAVGPARTATVVATDDPDIPGLAGLLDDLRPGSVLVLGWRTDVRASVWGGLAATRTAASGCRGLVTDGFVRDLDEVRGLPLAVWAAGTTPLSGKGRLAVVDVGRPTVVGGVVVAEQDQLVLDATGVCVCPSARWDEVLEAARGLMDRDEAFRRALAGGAGFAAARRESGTM